MERPPLDQVQDSVHRSDVGHCLVQDLPDGLTSLCRWWLCAIGVQCDTFDHLPGCPCLAAAHLYDLLQIAAVPRKHVVSSSQRQAGSFSSNAHVVLDGREVGA